MTIRLFDQNPQLREFTAQVLACEQKGDQYLIMLDQTAFFPEGGGQGADHGTLGGVNVLDAHEHGGVIAHLTDAPLPVGETVTGCVDSARRLAMSQQHSGEHMFSGLVCRMFGYDNVGFHIGSDAVTMDFNGPLTEEDVLRVERLVNEAIWRNQPIKAYFPPKEELEALAYRSKKALTGDVRIVTIDGVDTCACCGTHMPYTGGVGQVKVIGLMKYKSGVRVSVLCGVRALEYENLIQRQVKDVAKALSVKLNEAAGAVERLIAERDQLRGQNEQLAMRLFEAEAAQEKARAVRMALGDMLPASQLRKAAGLLAQGARLALVIAPREGGWNFAMSSEQEDVRGVTRALCAAFGGKGGGPKDMTQGVLTGGTAAEIRAAFEQAAEAM